MGCKKCGKTPVETNMKGDSVCPVHGMLDENLNPWPPHPLKWPAGFNPNEEELEEVLDEMIEVSDETRINNEKVDSDEWKENVMSEAKDRFDL